MSNAIAIFTESGFGKTSSLGKISKEDLPGLEEDIQGVNPEETLLINVKGKPLPFRGWKKFYSPITIDSPPLTGNYLSTTDHSLIVKTMNFFDTNRPDIKNIIIDDAQYLMAEEFMNNALKAGFEKFSKMAKNMYDVINAGIKLRPNVNFIILAHSEETKDGYKMKTIGKMLDEKVTLEGLFTVILYGKTSFNPSEKTSKKEFVTNFDGQYPAKSPIGMFKKLYIPNDLGLVINTVNDYYNGE